MKCSLATPSRLPQFPGLPDIRDTFRAFCVFIVRKEPESFMVCSVEIIKNYKTLQGLRPAAGAPRLR